MARKKSTPAPDLMQARGIAKNTRVRNEMKHYATRKTETALDEAIQRSAKARNAAPIGSNKGNRLGERVETLKERRSAVRHIRRMSHKKN